jgi:hypothetical protein
MQDSEITAGSPVIITDAYGNEIKTRALSGVEIDGRSALPVVRVERPLKDGSTESAPWPLEAVRPALARYARLVSSSTSLPFWFPTPFTPTWGKLLPTRRRG